jgi:hypothetical protein
LAEYGSINKISNFKKSIMKYFELSVVRVFLAITMLTSLFSCVKNDDFFGDKDAASTRKAIVRIKDAENDITTKARDVSPTIDEFVLIELRRDANDESDLNQPLTVSLVKNSSLITAYNTANGTNYVELPASSYQLIPGISDITFLPGETVKEIKIKVDKSSLSLSTQYALGFSIATVGPNGAISSAFKDAVYAIGIKNKYDGKYRLDGKFYHPSQSPGYDAFTIEVEMHTVGPNSVKLFSPDLGRFAAPGLFGGSLNAFGLQEPVFTIDPVTNKVTVQNGAIGAVTFYTMSPTYNSHYEPGPPQKIFASWGYRYAAGPTFDPANNREWTYVLTYLGPR